MKKILFFSFIFWSLSIHASAQTVSLSGIYDAQNAMVTLNWNMVSKPFRTAYILLRSADGISWTEVVKDRMLRNYNADDIYTYYDKKFLRGKSFYRLIISDGGNKTVALSTIINVNTALLNNTTTNASRNGNPSQQNNVQSKNIQQQKNIGNSNSWVIYPNPARDFLYLNYKGREALKGIVNVTIQDGSGKTVIKFRSGSMYNNIQIPISNLQRGVYFIQVIVMDELMMNQRFIKQ